MASFLSSIFPWPELIKKKACQFLLQHYLGRFLQEKLSLDQLTLNLYNGTGTVSNVVLDVFALNEAIESTSSPVEVVDGHIDEISVKIPWSKLVQDSTVATITGLSLTLQPKAVSSDTINIADALLSSLTMSTSMQVAQECFRSSSIDEFQNNQFDAIELLAQTVEAVLLKVQLILIDTVIKIEVKHGDSLSVFEIRIDRVFYSDDAGEDIRGEEIQDTINQPFKTSNKTFRFHDITVWYGNSKQMKYSEAESRYYSMYTCMPSEDSKFMEDEADKVVPIMVGKLCGDLEIKLHLKSDPNSPNSVIADIDGFLGSVHLFLQPLQIHVLIELIDQLMTSTKSTPPAAKPANVGEKAMTSKDYEMIENEFIHQNMFKQEFSGRGYHSIPFQDIDEFHSIKEYSFDQDLHSSMVSGTTEFSATNTATSCQTEGVYQKEVPSMSKAETFFERMTNESLRVKLRLSCANIFIFIDDTTANGEAKFAAASHRFFNSLSIRGFGRDDEPKLLQAGREACGDAEALRIFSAPLRLDVTMRNGGRASRLSVTAITLDVSEVLPNNKGVVSLLKFENILGQPHLNFTITTSPRATTIRLTSSCAITELDLGLYDRIHALHKKPRNSSMSSSKSSVELSFFITCPRLTLLFRFPIIDMRPGQPWWERNVRNEAIKVVGDDFDFSFMVATKKIELSCRSLSLDFVEITNEGLSSIPLVNVVELNHELPHITTVFHEFVPPDKYPDCGPEAMFTDKWLGDDSFSYPNQQPSPFSSKLLLHECEQLMLPGNTEEMLNFRQSIKNNCRLEVSIVLPSVAIFLPSHEVVNCLYNRVSNDLLLWEPQAPVEKNSSEYILPEDVGLDLASQVQGIKAAEFFSMRNESSEEYPSFQSMHQSVYEPRAESLQTKNNQSWLSVQLYSSNIRMVMSHHIQVSNDGDNEEHELFGESCADLSEACLFLVVGYQGVKNETIFTFEAFSCDLYHNGNIAQHITHLPGGLFSIYDTSQLMQVISRSSLLHQAKTFFNDGEKSFSEKMLSIAIKLKNDKVNDFKEITCAIRVLGAVLNHTPVPAAQLWVNQLHHMFNVKDEEVMGYSFSPVVLQLYFHANDSLVIHKIAHRALSLWFSNLSICSNVVAVSPSLIVRVMLEDAGLFLSTSEMDSSYVDYSKGWVCVASAGVVQLSLNLSSENNPRVHVNVSCDKVNLRTCADSLLALSDALTSLIPSKSPPPNSDDGPIKNAASDEQISEMVADALKEPCNENPDSINSNESPPTSGLFLFPDDDDTTEISDDLSNPNISLRHDENSDDDFCIIETSDHFYPTNNSESLITFLAPVKIQENFFAPLACEHDIIHPPTYFPNPIVQYQLSEINFSWHLYGGSDLSPGRNSHYREFTRVSDLFSEGGPNRNTSVTVEVKVSKMRLFYSEYDQEHKQRSRFVVSIGDVEIIDRLISSSINKLLYQYATEANPRPAHSQMLLLKIMECEPEAEQQTGTEYVVRMSMLPIKLNFDQDTVFFISSFFSSLLPESQLSSKPVSKNVQSSPAPISRKELVADKSHPRAYIRKFTFSPPILIRFDYRGKSVNVDNGRLLGLLAGLAQINCSHITMKAIHKHGILGFEMLVVECFKEWLTDVKRNQFSGIISGLGPMYSFTQIASGLCDLVRLPVEQYRRDGRIVKGFQKGAHSFSTSTAAAVLELAGIMVGGVQTCAETMFDLLSPSPNHHIRHQQPIGLRDGFFQAYAALFNGIALTITELAKEAKHGHDTRGVSGAVGGVVRQIPSTVIRPLIFSSEATSAVIDGVRNQILPDARREAIQKWKTS